MKEISAQTVFTGEDRLLPRFALPTGLDSIHELELVSRSEGTPYQFDTREGMLRFQTVLTGYEICHDQGDITCQFSEDAKGLDTTEKARIQLWQDPIGQLREVGTTKSSQHSASSSGSDVRGDSVTAPLSRAATISSTQAGTVAHPVKLSTLVVFAPLKGDKHPFAIILVELGPEVEIDPTQCDCCIDYNMCSKLCLTRTNDKRNNKRLKFRVLYAETDPQGSPDYESLDLFQLRIPRHPGYRKLPIYETLYLMLRFRNLHAKALFHEELSDRFKVRNAQLQEQNHFARRSSYLQGRPQTFCQSMSQSSGQ